MNDVGVVVIGRNEGPRLLKCLDSVLGHCRHVVYVDSDSTDQSVSEAKARGVEVVELDKSTPFTAALARNEGFGRLLEMAPEIRYVHFVDGDCELEANWLGRCRSEFEGRDSLAVLCGTLRERYPEASIYNRLFEMELNCDAGEVDACGGIFMIRADAFEQVGRFKPKIIAGEEPELCLRLRRKGWKIVRLEDDMGWHDAAMTYIAQWWTRMVRSGHAYAEGFAMHGWSPDRYCVRECCQIWAYGCSIPFVALALAWFTNGLSLWLLMVYPAQIWRITRGRRKRGEAPRQAILYSVFVMLAKVPQCMGQIRYWANRCRGRVPKIIEYVGCI